VTIKAIYGQTLIKGPLEAQLQGFIGRRYNAPETGMKGQGRRILIRNDLMHTFTCGKVIRPNFNKAASYPFSFACPSCPGGGSFPCQHTGSPKWPQQLPAVMIFLILFFRKRKSFLKGHRTLKVVYKKLLDLVCGYFPS
jgi:hypothetical protein